MKTRNGRKVALLLPAHRSVYNAINYLSTMHHAYQEMFGDNTEIESWYHNGYAALTHHLYNNILQ